MKKFHETIFCFFIEIGELMLLCEEEAFWYYDICITNGGAIMQYIFLISLMMMVICVFLKPKLIQLARKNEKVRRKIKGLTWFNNHWYVGFSLFIGNAVIFFVSLLLIFFVSFTPVPFLHVVIFILTALVSLYFWSIINVSWHGTKIERLKLGTVGSFFYVFISIQLFFESLGYNLNGNHESIELLGLLINILISGVAFMVCFFYTSFSSSDEQ